MREALRMASELTKTHKRSPKRVIIAGVLFVLGWAIWSNSLALGCTLVNGVVIEGYRGPICWVGPTGTVGWFRNPEDIPLVAIFRYSGAFIMCSGIAYLMAPFLPKLLSLWKS